MKLCFFVSDITHTGGIERVTSNLIYQFSKDRKDIDIDVVSQFKSGDKIWYNFDGCNIKFLSNKNYDAKPHSVERMIKMFSNALSVRKFFKKNKYDLIIAQSFPNVFLLFLSGISMCNVIAAEHVYYDYYSDIFKKIRIYIYKKCRKIIVLTSLDKKCYDAHCKSEHTVLIPNPVIVPYYSNSPLENKQAIAMGRIQHQKGFDTLIDAFVMVHEKHPDWVVNIYGDGNDKEKIAKYITDKGMDNIVILKGRTDNVPGVMEDASFFILSSRFEGFGMVIAEAMSQGLPAVSFDCPTGPSDIIKTNVNGILVENQNIKALADAICYMIEHPYERKEMGKRALNSVKDFSGESVAQKWYKLFEEIERN